MLELKRIYWTRQLLRLAMAALTVWIFAAAILSLVARSGKATAVRPPTTVSAIFTGMFDGVLAAVALAGVLAVVLTISASVIRARDVKRRDPVRRFSRQQRREGMSRAEGQCEIRLFRLCTVPVAASKWTASNGVSAGAIGWGPHGRGAGSVALIWRAERRLGALTASRY
ncbi:hypothetical protein [Arthrobacter sp. Bi26]|uniref:hypothetical protein n=1 Tax=Arthrobacter sp. Bi26 TaxID=2822350 RepID=UPI001E560231|nr:hypothetical protein [Arthrobacter sp. Bi26]